MKYEGHTGFEHGLAPSLGVLLVQLGTPDAPTKKALYPYLREFLGDPRVIEKPRLLWWFILHFLILPRRPKRSAKLYKKIWTEQGSPLRVITEQQVVGVRERLEKQIEGPVVVDYAMRYGNPSIKSVLDTFRKKGVTKLLVLPLYPQYSATSTGSVFDEVADALKRWRWVPEFRFMSSFHDDPGYISALANTVRERWQKEGEPEKLVMSFHGIPKRYFAAGDPYYCHCMKTGRRVAEELGLHSEQFVITFQSLFGKEEWLEPPTDGTLKALAVSGVKKVDVICPGFIADCLETLEEIDEENREIFLENGGKQFRYVPALNDRADFLNTLTNILLQNSKF